MKNSFSKNELREDLEEFFGDAITKKSLNFDIIIMFLIFLSSVIFVLETSITNNIVLNLLSFFDFFILIIFSIELILRFYIARSKAKFFTSFYSWIDILAVVPFWFGISSQSIRMFRLLRVFRFLRFLNFSKRYTKTSQINDFDLEKLFIFRILFTVFMLIFVSSALVYQVESHINEDINSIWDAFYFVLISITTVGYGDIIPVSDLARAIIMVSTLGFIIIVPVHITSMFKYLAEERNHLRITCKGCGLNHHQKDSRYCRNCGKKL